MYKINVKKNNAYLNQLSKFKMNEKKQIFITNLLVD